MAARKGFTLIELMVVIAIIAILSTVGFVSFTNAQIAGRDARRKQDLRSIAQALELYYQRYHHYPCPTNWQNSSDSVSGFWIINNDSTNCSDTSTAAFDTNYINALPHDPAEQPCWGGNNYCYSYWGFSAGWAGGNCPAAEGQYYYLVALLENKNDKDAIGNNGLKFCGGQRFYPDLTWMGQPSLKPNNFVIASQ